MGVYPKVFFIKGGLVQDPTLHQLLQNQNELSGLSLVEFFLSKDLEVANGQLFFLGENEGDNDEYLLLIVSSFDKHTSIVGSIKEQAEVITKFFAA